MVNRLFVPVFDYARFLAKVDRGPHHNPYDDCDLWTASTFSTGYGQFSYEGKNWKASRFVWFALNGPIPEETPWVLHHCDNPPCVNLAHLWLGTQQDNEDDKTQKERQCKGSANGRAKLSKSEVVTIIEWAEAGESQSSIAKVFGVHQTQISRIVRRKAWAAESGLMS